MHKMAITRTKLFSLTKRAGLDHATNTNKRELLAKLVREFRIMKCEPRTKDNMTEVPSAFDELVVGCICHEKSDGAA